MKTSESILALVRAISNFSYTFDFAKSTELLSEIERLDLSSEQLKLMNNLQSLCKDLERVLIPDTQKLRDLLDTSWATQQEQEKQNLLQLFTSIYFLWLSNFRFQESINLSCRFYLSLQLVPKRSC